MFTWDLCAKREAFLCVSSHRKDGERQVVNARWLKILEITWEARVWTSAVRVDWKETSSFFSTLMWTLCARMKTLLWTLRRGKDGKSESWVPNVRRSWSTDKKRTTELNQCKSMRRKDLVTCFYVSVWSVPEIGSVLDRFKLQKKWEKANRER